MWSCDQNLVTLAGLYKDLTRRKNLSEGCSWFKFNNLRMAQGMALKFHTSEARGLKLRNIIIPAVQKYFKQLKNFAIIERHSSKCDT